MHSAPTTDGNLIQQFWCSRIMQARNAAAARTSSPDPDRASVGRRQLAEESAWITVALTSRLEFWNELLFQTALTLELRDDVRGRYRGTDLKLRSARGLAFQVSEEPFQVWILWRLFIIHSCWALRETFKARILHQRMDGNSLPIGVDSGPWGTIREWPEAWYLIRSVKFLGFNVMASERSLTTLPYLFVRSPLKQWVTADNGEDFTVLWQTK
jgi:hypothetical protein